MGTHRNFESGRGARGLGPFLCVLGLALVLFGPETFAQEPPLAVPAGALPRRSEDAIVAGGWLLSRSIRFSTYFTDNFFQSPTNPLATAGFGESPSVTAEWS